MSLERADALFHDNKYQEAAAEFEAVVKQTEPNVNPLVYNNLATCCKEMKQYDQAISHFKGAMKGFMLMQAHEEHLRRLQFNIAQCHEKSKRYDLAKVYYEEANKAGEEDPEISAKILWMSQKIQIDSLQPKADQEEHKVAPKRAEINGVHNHEVDDGHPAEDERK